MCHKQHLHASSCMTHVGARIERGERGKRGGGGTHACLGCLGTCGCCGLYTQVMQVVAQLWIQHGRLQLLSL